jgi:hypothetical protein
MLAPPVDGAACQQDVDLALGEGVAVSVVQAVDLGADFSAGLQSVGHTGPLDSVCGLQAVVVRRIGEGQGALPRSSPGSSQTPVERYKCRDWRYDVSGRVGSGGGQRIPGDHRHFDRPQQRGTAGAAGGLHRDALHHGGDISGQLCRICGLGKVAFLLSPA